MSDSFLDFPYCKPVNYKSVKYESISPNLVVKFSVKRINTARVVWINKKWLHNNLEQFTLSETNIDLFTQAILDTFGVISTTNKLKDLSSISQENYLFADRYGATGGTVQGGSGRCGSLGYFNAKGIGITPLVSQFADINHRNGVLAYEECIKEVVNSCIMDEQLPIGVIPIVAFIDTGLDYYNPETGKSQRCGILVRPNFIRPAHFERSIKFGTAGTEFSDQFIDACRVRDMVLFTFKNMNEQFKIESYINEITGKFIKTVAYCNALRLWQGRFLSSNVSVDGNLLDLGPLNSVPNWCNFRGGSGKSFGKEINNILNIQKSLKFYFTKHLNFDNSESVNRNNNENFYQLYQNYFLDACTFPLSNDLGDKSNIQFELRKHIWNLYTIQQKKTYFDYDKNSYFHPWVFKKGNSKFASKAELETIEIIEKLIIKISEKNYKLTKKMKSIFSQKTDLFYDSANNLYKNVEDNLIKRPLASQLILDDLIKSLKAKTLIESVPK